MVKDVSRKIITNKQEHQEESVAENGVLSNLNSTEKNN